jgi:hypothetical protein
MSRDRLGDLMAGFFVVLIVVSCVLIVLATVALTYIEITRY